jgi:hypothetical protein
MFVSIIDQICGWLFVVADDIRDLRKPPSSGILFFESACSAIHHPPAMSRSTAPPGSLAGTARIIRQHRTREP